MWALRNTITNLSWRIAADFGDSAPIFARKLARRILRSSPRRRDVNSGKSLLRFRPPFDGTTRAAVSRVGIVEHGDKEEV